MLQNRKGFTLIELMIVVAIIGILAAVAIPGFMTYIKNSKTSEAKTNLDAIKKGALAYYEAEHYGPDGMTAISKQYPNIGSAARKLGAEPSEKTIGVKQSPATDNIKKTMSRAPWSLLNFKLTSPFYYSYAYVASGQSIECTEKDGVETCATKDAKAGFTQSRFQATACASLNTKQDSIFSINGYSDGSVSPVIERGSCYAATAPTADP